MLHSIAHDRDPLLMTGNEVIELVVINPTKLILCLFKDFLPTAATAQGLLLWRTFLKVAVNDASAKVTQIIIAALDVDVGGSLAPGKK